MSLGLIGLLLLAGSAHAQFARAEAEYRSEQLQVRVVVLDRESGAAAASAVLTQGACSASVAGIGQIRQRVLVLEPYVKLPGAESCRVVLSFDTKWSRTIASSRGDCSAYGGAACEWTGQAAQRVGD